MPRLGRFSRLKVTVSPACRSTQPLGCASHHTGSLEACCRESQTCFCNAYNCAEGLTAASKVLCRSSTRLSGYRFISRPGGPSSKKEPVLNRHLGRSDNLDLHQAELSCHDGLEAQRARGRLPQIVSPVVHEMRQYGREGKDMAAGRDLRADWGLQRDGAVDFLCCQHFYLQPSFSIRTGRSARHDTCLCSLAVCQLHEPPRAAYQYNQQKDHVQASLHIPLTTSVIYDASQNDMQGPEQTRLSTHTVEDVPGQHRPSPA